MVLSHQITVSYVCICDNHYSIIQSCEKLHIYYDIRDNLLSDTSYDCAWYLVPAFRNQKAICPTCSSCIPEENILLVGCCRCAINNYKTEILYAVLNSTYRFVRFVCFEDVFDFPNDIGILKEGSSKDDDNNGENVYKRYWYISIPYSQFCSWV